MSFRNNVLPVHCGSIFSWSKTYGHTNVSDIRGKIDAQIWFNSCDEGFIVKSHRTGINVLFVLEDVNHDGDNDIISWVYTPAFSGDAPEGIKIIIYND